MRKCTDWVTDPFAKRGRASDLDLLRVGVGQGPRRRAPNDPSTSMQLEEKFAAFDLHFARSEPPDLTVEQLSSLLNLDANDVARVRPWDLRFRDRVAYFGVRRLIFDKQTE